MIMKRMFLGALVALGLTGCVMYDDGLPMAPAPYPVYFGTRIGYSYTYHHDCHEHRRAHFMPERGPAGHPGAKHPNNPKPGVPGHGTRGRTMPSNVR